MNSCLKGQITFSRVALLSIVILIFLNPFLTSSDSEIKGAVLNMPTNIEKDVNVAIVKKLRGSSDATNDVAMPVSIGHNLNISTGGNASSKNSVIMKA